MPTTPDRSRDPGWTSLITTKLHPPPRRSRALDRSQSRPTLAPPTRRLAVVSAPAGFGKTSLLVDWACRLRDQGVVVGWVSLDHHDNDPARLLRYVVGSIHDVDTQVGTRVLAGLGAPRAPIVELLLEELVNELAASQRQYVVILDDYQLITSAQVHAMLDALVANMPRNVRLVVAGRVDPPLSLARMRARDELAEVRAADLRFDHDEVAGFLRDVMSLTVGADDVISLADATEGWAAGLQLAALSLRGHEDVATFTAAFARGTRHVLDFLADEVFNGQDQAIREFLLTTSILNRMSASLSNAVRDANDSQELLERLERDNLFVIPLDDERHWYRYHHLFAEFLRSRLTVELPGGASALHRRASAWFESEGLESDAIEHAFAGGDLDTAARLVEDGVRAAWSRGEAPTVLRWMDSLPGETKRRRPRLLLHQAQALVLMGRAAEAEQLVAEVEQLVAASAPDAQARDVLSGFAASIRSAITRMRGDAPRAVELGRRALNLLPVRENHLRNYAAVCLAEGLRVTGDLEGVAAALDLAVRVGISGGHVYGTITACAYQARLHTVRGDLRACEETVTRALSFIADRSAQMSPAAGNLYISRGALQYERDELASAGASLREGVRRAELSQEVAGLVWGYYALSKLKLAEGDRPSAVDALENAAAVATSAGSELELALVTNWRVRLELSGDDPNAAAARLRQRRLGHETARTTEVATRIVERLTTARLAHAGGDHEGALRTLADLEAETEAAGRTGNLLEVLTLKTLAPWRGGRRPSAVATLGRAVVLAQPQGFLRTFVDEESRDGDLLAASLEIRRRARVGEQPVSGKYLTQLQAALASKYAAERTHDGGPDAPSGRELEVLALISGGASNAQIADRLYVSTSTVKTHVNNLYRKLGARSRVHAVAQARDLGLL